MYSCNVFFKPSAELRTISLCDSDLFMQSYNANRRKFSAASNSPAVSCYSGTESQQSVSARSLYDNVEVAESKDELKTSRFLMPPKVPKSSLVNRSKSFQETGQCRKHLLTRKLIFLRRNLHESSSIEDRFQIISNRSSTPIISSTVSDTNIDCSVTQPNEIIQSNCSCDNKSNDPFFMRVLRRLQKLSHQWRKCKRVRRGREWWHVPNPILAVFLIFTHSWFSNCLF